MPQISTSVMRDVGDEGADKEFCQFGRFVEAFCHCFQYCALAILFFTCVVSSHCFHAIASKTVLCFQDSASKSVLWPPYSLRVLSQAISFKTVLWLVWTFRHYKWCFGQCFGRFKIVLWASRICWHSFTGKCHLKESLAELAI